MLASFVFTIPDEGRGKKPKIDVAFSVSSCLYALTSFRTLSRPIAPSRHGHTF